MRIALVCSICMLCIMVLKTEDWNSQSKEGHGVIVMMKQVCNSPCTGCTKLQMLFWVTLTGRH